MGIQATIKTADLLNAGCTVRVDRDVSYYWDDTADMEVEYESFLTFVVFPCGVECGFHGNAADGSVWIDFNHWGSNRPRLQPLLERHHIPWIEG